MGEALPILALGEARTDRAPRLRQQRRVELEDFARRLLWSKAKDEQIARLHPLLHFAKLRWIVCATPHVQAFALELRDDRLEQRAAVGEDEHVRLARRADARRIDSRFI